MAYITWVLDVLEYQLLLYGFYFHITVPSWKHTVHFYEFTSIFSGWALQSVEEPKEVETWGCVTGVSFSWTNVPWLDSDGLSVSDEEAARPTISDEESLPSLDSGEVLLGFSKPLTKHS